MSIIAIFSGFGIGAIVGMTGVGGGSLMTPLLIGAFRLSPTVAIGTDLWFASITKSGGAWAHHRHGQVDRRIAGLLLAGSLPTTAATLGWMHATGVTPLTRPCVKSTCRSTPSPLIRFIPACPGGGR